MTKREYQLLGVSSDGFASLLDVTTGIVDASMTLPPPDHLRRNDDGEAAQYEALLGALQVTPPLNS